MWIRLSVFSFIPIDDFRHTEFFYYWCKDSFEFNSSFWISMHIESSLVRYKHPNAWLPNYITSDPSNVSD